MSVKYYGSIRSCLSCIVGNLGRGSALLSRLLWVKEKSRRIKKVRKGDLKKKGIVKEEWVLVRGDLCLKETFFCFLRQKEREIEHK